MFAALLAEVLGRHDEVLSEGCRSDIAATMERLLLAPTLSLGLPEAAAGRALPPPSSVQTWTGLDEAPTESHSTLPPRYVDRGLLGYGGMGQVRRVLDSVLDREVALKMVKAQAPPRSIAQFTEEAKITARLQHPGVVPIYDLGVLANGLPYYTMPVVSDHSLSQVIATVHQASSNQRWGRSWDGTGMRRLIVSFLAACEAVAYAHSHGIVHRDLKPENVMLGEFGETLVVDWGLARVAGDDDEQRVSGTPSYMPPEQARGEPTSRRSDVYGLGAILYEILSGHPPYQGAHALEVIEAVKAGPPPAVTQASALPVPDELAELCTSCMERDPARRPASARLVANAAAEWLDGARRRDEGRKLVRQAETLFTEVRAARALARERSDEAARREKAVGRHAPIEQKREVWGMQDDARSLERQAAIDEQRALQALRTALNQAPELPEAHERLAAYYQRLHVAAEAERRNVDAATLELSLRQHDRGHFARYLSAVGTFSLITDPDVASVEVLSFVERDRRLITQSTGVVLRTPIVSHELPIGSYLLRIRAPGRRVVDYPIHIAREEHWSGIRPESSSPHPVLLPRADALGPDDCYVPAGWCIVGGDPEAKPSHPRRRVWLDGFVMRRYPVTNDGYLQFLDRLAGCGKLDEAMCHVPRERATSGLGEAIYGLADGAFHLKPDGDGDLWDPSWPVFMVRLHDALAYARAEGAHSGLPWRLPGEYECEKAARGADGRFFPWGDFGDPTWANLRDASPQGAGPATVSEFPIDVSLYGVRHLAGNAWTWCLDPYSSEPTFEDGGRYELPELGDLEGPRTGRGGDWYAAIHSARSARRLRAMTGEYRDGTTTFRLARSVVPEHDG